MSMSNGERWSDGETSVLIDVWAPLVLRRSSSSRACDRHLTADDWRLVATAVNAHRASSGLRSNRAAAQCKERVRTLKCSSGPFSGRLRAVLDGLPPGFGPAVKNEQDEDDDEDEEEEDDDEEEEVVCLGGGSGGLPGTTMASGRPGKGLSTAAAVVTKLAEVYERVEMAALKVEKERIKMEMERNRKTTSCSCD